MRHDANKSLARRSLSADNIAHSRVELNQISDSYKKYCGGSEMMSGEQFTALFTQLGCPEKLCHRCFRFVCILHNYTHAWIGNQGIINYTKYMELVKL